MTNFLALFIILLPLLILVAGLLGIIIWQKNLVLIILGLEICYISANVGFVLTSLYFDDIFGFIFSLSSLTLAGAEISFGLTLTILIFRKLNTIFSQHLIKLKN